MRPLLLLFFFFFIMRVNATTYYFSASGSDLNNGTSPSTPWKSLAKFNAVFASKSPGDNFLFERGNVFYGSLKISRSGSAGLPITIGAYGFGANPVITGFTNIISWTNLGNNIWESSNAVSILSSCNIVVINGVNTPMGRTPNTGWYNIDSYSGNTSITSSSLNSSINWTGAEVVIRKAHWVIDRSPITSQSGSSLSYISGSSYNAQAKWGFFIQNDRRTLDVPNEWYYNPTTKKIDIYSSTSPANVELSTIDTLVTCRSVNYITFDNITFQGANKDAFTISGSNIIIQNCNIDFSGKDAVWGAQNITSSSGFVLQNSTINHTNNNAINLETYFSGAIISNNKIQNTGLIPGMGANGSTNYSNYVAIQAGANNILIQNNEIDSTGYNGIAFYHNGIIIKNNLVNTFCLTADDGAGIYTWVGSGNTPFVGLKILNNIVLNGVGNNSGTPDTGIPISHGIYLDDATSGVEVSGNTAANCSASGLYLHNSNNLNIHNNTFFNNAKQQVLFSSFDINYPIRNVLLKNNLILSKTSTQKVSSFQTRVDDIKSFGIIDSNYWARPIDDNLTFETVINSYTTYTQRTLSGWQTYSNFDLHSSKSPKSISTVNDLVFVYNPTSASTTLPLNANYIDVKNTSYNGTITLQPYSSAVLIRNGAINQFPTASAGQDQTITLPTNSLTLSGSGTDPDGTIISYLWTQLSGPSGISIINPTSPGTSVTRLLQGIYQFQLKVTDNNNAIAMDTVRITVNPAPNQPPVANAGNDQIIALPLTIVTLSGSGTDPDGTIVSYKWKEISGPLCNLLSDNLPVTNVSGLVQGIYQFQLTVMDNDSATASDVVLVTVQAASNIPPVANAGTNQTITLPTNTISLSGSGNDSDGIIVSYTWTKISGPSGDNIVNPNSSVTEVNSLSEGVYQYQLQVVDNDGAIGTDLVQITVNVPVNIPPVANAGTDQIITLPSNSVTLSGSGSDTDGNIVSYMWTEISGPNGDSIANENSAVADVNNLSEGTYQFQLTVTDNNGAIGTDIIQVTVNTAPNIAPVANAGADQTITLPVNTITLWGSGSDSDGNIISYAWSVISGPLGCNIINPNSLSTNVTGLSEGVYKFQLEVTDNNGATTTDIMLVTVNAAPNISPVADAGADQVIILPRDTLTIFGRGSDVDGTVGSYGWAQISGPSGDTIQNINSPVTIITGLKQGIYQFQLTVTDNDGAIGTDIMQLIVNPAVNIPPQANAGIDQLITLPQNMATLTGSGNDPDGTVVSYNWKQISGPSGDTIKNINSPVTNITGLTQGAYQFQLTVTDNDSAVGSDIVQIIVNSIANLPPVANAGTGQTITSPLNTVTLSGSGSDADGVVDSYKWTKLSGPSSYNIINSDSAITDVTNLVEGVYQFQLTVTDNNGITSADVVIISVNSAINIPPVANAGADQIITLPVNLITLSGAGNDSDGTISSYKWTEISGPSSYNISNSDSAITNVTNLVEGVYQFQLQVIDNNGAIGTDIIQVMVAASNLPPSSNAGTDQIITLPSNIVTLFGSGNDSDGTISSYQWTEISGPASYNISTPDSAITNVTNLVEGIYQFQLLVVDNNGAIGTSIMQVSVNAANIPPVADAGADQTITLPTDSLTFSGSGSDLDGLVVSYNWTKISGPSSYSINDATSPSVKVSGLIEGVYFFELKVTDDNGASSYDTIQITVNASANQPPVANAGTDQTIALPVDSVSLSGNASDTDGTIVSYAWTKISGPSVYNIENASSSSTNINGLVQGLYQFQLTVTDNNGATGVDTVQVLVNIAGNISPTVNAGANQAITLPINSVVLSGTGNDADGTIVSYEWTQISGLSVDTIINATSSSTNVTGLVQGIYQFQLTVTDNGGATATSIVQITVNATINISPVANAGVDQMIKLPTNSVTLSGSGTDADGTVVSYEWSKIAGPSAYSIVDANAAVTDVTNLIKGIYKFQLKVTDNNGATGISIIKISVNGQGNQPPSADAGADQTIMLPLDTITLSGSGADADGSVVSYNWSLISGPSTYNIINANTASTDVTDLVQGVYQFQLKITDNKGAIGTDIVQINVNAAPNQPPVANAGVDKQITLPTDSVTLNGSGIDTDGTISGYEWKLISGPSNCNITNASSAITNVNNLVEGTYQFQLIVTDNDSTIGTDIVQVNVKSVPNQPPIANAGTDQIITLPKNFLTLFGNGSDADGTIVSYVWTQISGPSSANILNADSSITGINNLVAGAYLFELTVTDDKGATGKDVMQVTVHSASNQAPVSNAGPDRIITLPVNSLLISGSGSDSDGTIVSYQWTKISGPVSFNILNSTSDSTTVNNLVQGVYQFQLTVTDNDGATSTDIMQVIVNGAPNQPPVANAGLDKIITLPANSLTLSGSGSDPDGTVAAYQWTKISGPSSYNILNPTSANTAIDNLVEGVYQFQLKVTDDKGASATDIVQVIVNGAPNQPPTVNAGLDQVIQLPMDSIILSGSGSDSDGTIVSYQWTKLSGPASYNIINSSSATTIIKNLIAGIYLFELKVTDNSGAIAIDAVQITVNEAPDVPPVANAGSDKIITLPMDSVILSGIGTDADGTIVNYQWLKIAGPASFNILNQTSAITTVNNLVQGVYQFQLKVTDDRGASATDIIQVTVNAAPNQPPTAHAGTDKIIALPTNYITLSGSGNDVDGTVVNYQWTKISGPSSYNIINSASALTTVNGLVQGVYQFQLKVTDNKGASGTDIIQVTVYAAPNQPPVANAGSDKIITLPSNSVSISGSGSDADGTIVGYQWSKISGPSTYNIVNPTSALTVINGLVQGVYQFELRVTDNNGGRGRDTMQITIKPAPNVPPTAHAGSDVTISLPTNTTSLTGSGTDVDGTIENYLWKQISGPSTYNITNPSSPVTDAWGLIKGVYKFELTVTDNNGAIGKDTVQIKVNAANIPPVANAGADETITLPTNSVTLSGSGTDADGTLSSYKWTQISGPSASEVLSPNKASTLLNNLVGGTYQFELTVTDNLGAVGKDTVAIVVAEPRLNLEDNNTINVYPNPVIDETTLEINTSQIYSKILITITDAKGLIVYKKEIPALQTNIKQQIDMSNLIKGMYVITVHYSDSKKQSIKVIRL